MDNNLTLETKTPDTAPRTSTWAIPEETQQFNWRQCWYPVCFLQDLPAKRPYSFSLYDEPLVLFRDQQGQLVCLSDRCPHRAAKLSDGQLIDGKIECLYHGWQFGSDGQCLHIPQLPADAKIPANACVQSFKVVERQGLIWMWAGEAEAAVEEKIPIIPELDEPKFVTVQTMRDLPFDQSYFIENVIDPAHANISHDGTRNGGKRENAQPLEMEVLEHSVDGIRGRLRGMGKSDANWTRLDFVAPNLIIYRINIPQRNWSGGLAFYSIPLGKGRCRIFGINFRNFLTWTNYLRPRWLEHWNRNQLLEEDLALIAGQQTQVEQLGISLKDLYLPLKTSDVMVIEYRKWLDKFGSSLPYYQGYLTSKNADSECLHPNLNALDRLSQHTLICGSCSRAYEVTKQVKQTSVGVAIAFAALAIITDNFGIRIAEVSASIAAVLAAFIAEKVKINFERAYTRH
ncbi:Rieske [2Fe-2S] domain-containing protein [Nostoc sp. NIES-4103]|nr:Rieske [2Fe-2S] domain-containing protein [Nostoc sp. NIES-4103]